MGQCMFGSKISQIVSIAVKCSIDLQIIQHFTPPAGQKVMQFDSDKLVVIRDAILVSIAEDVEGWDTLPSKRLIDIKYRSGVIPKVPITNMVMEVEYRVLAIARGALIYSGFLPELAAEQIMGFMTTNFDKQVVVDHEMPEMIKAIRY